MSVALGFKCFTQSSKSIRKKSLSTYSQSCTFNTPFIFCYRFDECVEGGESQLVDMFRVMEIFRKESPADFRVLTRVPIFFSTIDFKRKSPAYIKIRKPVIQLDYDDEV